MRIRVLRKPHEGSRYARGSPSFASPERTTRRPTCPSYHACLALLSHHQDASFTTSAALYGRTVASRRRHVPVRQAVRMTGMDLLKVPDAQRSSHDLPSTDRELEVAACNRSPADDRRRVRPSRPSRSRRCWRGNAPPRAPGPATPRPGVLPRVVVWVLVKTGLLVAVAALRAATVWRAQRAADVRLGQRGGTISACPSCAPGRARFSGGRQRARGVAAR